MLPHSQTRELINEIKTLIALAENHSLGYSALEHARKLVFHVETENSKPITNHELFCKVHSALSGEDIENVEQLKLDTMSGQQLYELCIAFHQAASNS